MGRGTGERVHDAPSHPPLALRTSGAPIGRLCHNQQVGGSTSADKRQLPKGPEALEVRFRVHMLTPSMVQTGPLALGRTATMAIIGALDSLTALLPSGRRGRSVRWGRQREIGAAPATIIRCATWRRALAQRRRPDAAGRRDTSAAARRVE